MRSGGAAISRIRLIALAGDDEVGPLRSEQLLEFWIRIDEALHSEEGCTVRVD
jgi:hypothetical protein